MLSPVPCAARAATLGLAALLVLPALALALPAARPVGHADTVLRVAAVPSGRAEVKRIESADGWTAYVSPERKGELCYLAGSPAKSESAGLKRKPVYLLVTHNTADKTSDVVSFIAGYAFKSGSTAQVEVGGKSFTLFTKDDTAWSYDQAGDRAIVAAMRKAKHAVIRGTPAHGGVTTDTYALTGFPRILAAIDKACRIKR